MIPEKWLARYVDVNESIKFWCDFETDLIQNNIDHAPKPVCMQFAWGDDAPDILSYELDRPAIMEALTLAFTDPQVTSWFWNGGFDLCVILRWFPELRVVVWAALAGGRVFDAMILEQLVDIRYGKYDQDGQCKWVFDPEAGKRIRVGYGLAENERLYKFPDADIHDKGNESWRLRYGELRFVPIEEWPDDAFLYAALDITGLRHVVTQGQFTYIDMSDRADFSMVHRCAEETYKAVGLIQSSNVSFHTDEDRFTKLKERLLRELHEATQALSEPIHPPGGCPTPTKPVCPRCNVLTRVKQGRNVCTQCGVAWPDDCQHRLVAPPRMLAAGKNAGTLTKAKRSTKLLEEVVAQAAREAGEEPRMANEGSSHVSTEAKYLLRFAEKNPVLAKQVTFNRVSKLVTTYLDILPLGFHNGIKYSVHTLLGTGRCSVSDPPLQQLPRKGGIRECLIAGVSPRTGKRRCIVSCDYGTLELRTLAQSALWIVGFSELAKALNSGMDVHVLLASDVLDLSYEDAVLLYEDGDEEVAEWRQLCKIGNFGFGGCMQPDTFVEYCLGYDKVITLDTSERIYSSFMRRWSEMKPLFSKVRKWVNQGRKQITLPAPPDSIWVDGMTKGDLVMTAGANFLFQGPAARGAKLAHARCTHECYGDPTSPLYGNAEPLLFAHDELLFEVEDEDEIRTACAKRIQRVMIDTMTEVASPDVTITADPVAMPRWIKGAKPVWKDGLLMLTQEKPS